MGVGGPVSQQMAGKILKGLYSAAVGCLGSLFVALSAPGASFSSLTDGQYVGTALAALVAFGGTYGLAGWPGPGIGGPKP